MQIHSDKSVDPPYPVYGGLFREEAIMLLRRFYVQENEKGVFACESCCSLMLWCGVVWTNVRDLSSS